MECVLEEVEVINSIYEDAAEYESSMSTVNLKIPETEVCIKIWFPGQYPDEAPKIIRVTGSIDEQETIKKFQTRINETFVPGEVYLFSFIDEIRCDAEIMEEEMIALQKEKEEKRNTPSVEVESRSRRISEWSKSSEIRDRGSTFIGHAIKVSSEEEMAEVVEDFLSDKKISQASHNMVAWRIRLDEEGHQFAHDFDNDGEAGAGTSMSHVLEMADAQNVVVVVSRYFHGTHIGSDRFRHIKNCTRDALVNGGFINK